MKRNKRSSAALLIAMTALVVATVGLNGSPATAVGETSVSIGSATRNLDGVDVARRANFLVLYTKSGTRTGTNQYGFEAAVISGKVTRVEAGVGNMAIPTDGYVLSGHGSSNTWLRNNARIGSTVKLNGAGSGATPLLPDLGVRTLRQFSIVNPTTGQFAGRKLLKFPGVTANIGDGPLEIKGLRSTSTSTDWSIAQIVLNTDGTKTQLASSSAGFVYGGDGHNHWHIRDFDSYELLRTTGAVLETGEKHGFCFEDNTAYRNWPGSAAHPASPANPVYTPANVCGVGQPASTQVMHALSVGWADTYPSTLPDQAIDVTGVANGEYIVKVDADWQSHWAETNENNNAATARIRITGNTVALISATDGL